MLADALLRSMTGTTALLRVTNTNVDTNQSEVGLVATTFADVPISPVVMRKLRPTWKEGAESMWELFVSATGVEQQVSALDLPSAESLFAMTLAVSVGGQDYLVESIPPMRRLVRYIFTGCFCETGQRRSNYQVPTFAGKRLADTEHYLLGGRGVVFHAECERLVLYGAAHATHGDQSGADNTSTRDGAAWDPVGRGGSTLQPTSQRCVCAAVVGVKRGYRTSIFDDGRRMRDPLSNLRNAELRRVGSRTST